MQKHIYIAIYEVVSGVMSFERDIIGLDRQINISLSNLKVLKLVWEWLIL